MSHRHRRETRREFIRDIGIGATGIILAPGLVAGCAKRLSSGDTTGWNLVPHILARIKAPSFPSRDFAKPTAPPPSQRRSASAPPAEADACWFLQAGSSPAPFI
jgi:hypothetical protein